MNLSRHSPAPTRYVGLGLVIALHLAGLYALSAGLMKAPARPHEATVLLPKLDEAPRDPPKPLDPVPAAQPRLTAPIVDIPTPPVWVDAPLAPAEPLARDPGPAPSTAPGPVAGPGVTQPVGDASPRIASAGAVCAVMPRPDVPVVSWSGEAVLHVVATVRGGRVVGSEVRVAQGALDAKTRRALQRSVETALAGYQCQGDAMFQQDFAFRLD